MGDFNSILEEQDKWTSYNAKKTPVPDQHLVNLVSDTPIRDLYKAINKNPGYTFKRYLNFFTF